MTSTLLRPPAERSLSGNLPHSPLVLDATLDALADYGYEALTVDLIRYRAGAAAPALDAAVELDDLVVAALQPVRLFATPEPTGALRDDLRLLLQPWESNRDRDARAVAAVLSAALWRPRLQEAAVQALDRPLAQALGSILARILARAEAAGERIPPHRLHTLNWILRSLTLDRLRAPTARTRIDLDELIDLLLAIAQEEGPDHADRHGHPEHSAPGRPLTGTAGHLP